jgi:hypothetical protein
VPAIFTQVQGDAVGATEFGQCRRPGRVGFNRFAGLANGRHVIDVDA